MREEVRRKKRHTVPFCLFFVYRELTRASVNWLGLAFPFLLLSLLPTLKSNRTPFEVSKAREEGALWRLVVVVFGESKGRGTREHSRGKESSIALLCIDPGRIQIWQGREHERVRLAPSCSVKACQNWSICPQCVHNVQSSMGNGCKRTMGHRRVQLHISRISCRFSHKPPAACDMLSPMYVFTNKNGPAVAITAIFITPTAVQ